MNFKQLWSILRGQQTNFRWMNASWTYYPNGDPMSLHDVTSKPLPWGINRIGSPYHPDVHCEMPNGRWAHAVCEPCDIGRFRAAWWVLTGRAYAFLWPKAGELEGIWQRLNPPEIRPSPRPFVPQADSRNLSGTNGDRG